MNDNNINAEQTNDKLYILLNLFKELPEALQEQMLKEIISTVQEYENRSQ